MSDDYYSMKAINERISKRLKPPALPLLQGLRERIKLSRLPKIRRWEVYNGRKKGEKG